MDKVGDSDNVKLPAICQNDKTWNVEILEVITMEKTQPLVQSVPKRAEIMELWEESIVARIFQHVV